MTKGERVAIFYSIQGADMDARIMLHPQAQMRKLGIKWHRAIPESISGGWMFEIDRSHVPSLPSYITVKEDVRFTDDYWERVPKESSEMDNEEYQDTQDEIVRIAREVGFMPIRDFLKRINVSEAVVPLIDPTLYKKAALKLQDIKRLAEAAKTMQDIVLEIKERELKKLRDQIDRECSEFSKD